MGNATDRRKTGQTALYRIWGDEGLLLYIGISNNFGTRWKEHAKRQPWWDEMRRLTADAWYDSRPEAEAAEEAAIKAEKPKYNKVHAVPAVRSAQPRPQRRGPSTAGLPKPFRTCSCRDPQTGMTLHGKCPGLRERDHGAWYARYTIPEGADGWAPGKNRKRRIGPFASKRQAEQELLRVLVDYRQQGCLVRRLPNRVA
jgi:predicted GIY-YIG superfamily endonuclease